MPCWVSDVATGYSNCNSNSCVFTFFSSARVELPRQAVRTRQQVCYHHACLYQDETSNWSRLNDVEILVIKPGEASWYNRSPARNTALYKTYSACYTVGCGGECRDLDGYCKQCQENQLKSLLRFSNNLAYKACKKAPVHSNQRATSMGVQPNDSSSPSDFKEPRKESIVEHNAFDSRLVSNDGKDSKCIGPYCKRSSDINGLCRACHDVLCYVNKSLLCEC